MVLEHVEVNSGQHCSQEHDDQERCDEHAGKKPARIEPRPLDPPELRDDQTGQGDDPQACPEEPGMKQARASGQKREHAQPRGAQPEVESQAFRRADLAPQPQDRKDQLSQPERGQHDQRGRGHDGETLGKVLDMAELCRRLAQKRFAKGQAGNHMRKRPPEKVPPPDRAPLAAGVGQRLFQEPPQPGQFQGRQWEHEK